MNRYRSLSLVAFCVIRTVAAQTEYGLARNYAGDAAIASDSRVIFVEDFEEPDIGTLAGRWDDVQRQQYMRLDREVPPGSSGTQSLTAPGTASGPGLYRRLLPGYDQVYLRYYAKFDDACSQVHHFNWVGGNNPATPYPSPRAGEKPAGDSHFSTGVEPRTDWQWDYYTTWPGMACWGQDTRTQCHGNVFLWETPKPAVPRGKWISVEVMVKMNSPVSESNGEQAFWIDGQKWGHYGAGFPLVRLVADKWTPDPNGTPFPGFQWRSVDALNVNYLWLYAYTDMDPACRVWFDHVVVATDYIGPMKPLSGAVAPAPPTNLQVAQ